MRKNIIYIIVSTWAFLFISCSEDFLEIDPEQNVAAENAVVDLNTLQTALNGVYSNLQSNGYYGRNLYVMPELMADNLFLSLRNTGRYLDFNNFVVSKEDSYVESSWNSIYEVAVNANRVIDGGENILEEFPGQEAQIKQLIGEAYALRSLAHFDLVRLFAQPYNYTLVANENYEELWAVDFNQETLMEVINTIADNAGTNGLGHFFDVTGYADALVTEDLVDTYSENDARLLAITAGSKPGAEEEAYFVNKFPNGTLHDDNIKILRLAEQYLIRAEAYAKTNQDELAQQDLQVVVNRADPDAKMITETGEVLIDRILLERRKELAFEGHRLFDLTRNKRDLRIDQGEGSVIEASYPNDKFILPIPLNEINANPEIQPQNPGY